jgi:hypothetical protein
MPSAGCRRVAWTPGDLGGNPQRRLFGAVADGTMAYRYDTWAQQAAALGLPFEPRGKAFSAGGYGCQTAMEVSMRCADRDSGSVRWPGDLQRERCARW